MNVRRYASEAASLVLVPFAVAALLYRLAQRRETAWWDKQQDEFERNIWDWLEVPPS
jgi:hypothetical protein